MTPGAGESPARTVFRVRRLADVKGVLRIRKQYEVGCWIVGEREPSWVRRTEHPGSVLRGEGVHSTDVYDFVALADQVWRGGTGPWCSPWPDEHE